MCEGNKRLYLMAEVKKSRTFATQVRLRSGDMKRVCYDPIGCIKSKRY